ncbi:MAG TPA: glycosyltransferase family 1 protein, partial [Hyphomicrobiaceae bacterium]|nr:glycosyltransferase family 1 protein [Hyphomicrobiaceae bacterium]
GAAMARRWSINGRFVTQPLTGVQRYAREIVTALDHWLAEAHPLARGLSVELLVPPSAAGDLPRLEAIRVRSVGRLRGHAWEQVELPAHARGGLLSLCNTGPLLARRQIVCLHDVNTRTHPQSYALPFRLLYRGLHPALGRTAARVATVSQHSAAQLAALGIAGRDKIAVIPNGYEHVLAWRPRHSEITRSAAGPRTVVVLGSPAPHKNVALVLGLADRLAAAGLTVAVVGERDARVFRDAAAPAAAAGNVLWLGRLPDDELAALLRDSLCLAFPSLAEGFGIPPLEAMTLGCPVVASDRASLPEVCGDAALYASPEDADAWLASFLRLAGDERLRADLVRRGDARARRFSWRASAVLYLQAMAEVDGIAAVPSAAGQLRRAASSAATPASAISEKAP